MIYFLKIPAVWRGNQTFLRKKIYTTWTLFTILSPVCRAYLWILKTFTTLFAFCESKTLILTTPPRTWGWTWPQEGTWCPWSRPWPPAQSWRLCPPLPSLQQNHCKCTIKNVRYSGNKIKKKFPKFMKVVQNSRIHLKKLIFTLLFNSLGKNPRCKNLMLLSLYTGCSPT